jgi:hypothetical protein
MARIDSSASLKNQSPDQFRRHVSVRKPDESEVKAQASAVFRTIKLRPLLKDEREKLEEEITSVD